MISGVWRLRLAVGAGAILFVGGDAFSESASPPKFEASVILGATSDYVYRGVSLSGERPTGIAFVEAKYGFAYFNGMLVGNDLGRDALDRSIGTLEADATIGLAPSLGIVDFNVGGKFTGYPNGRDIVAGTLITRERDFLEFFAGATLNLSDVVSVGGTAYWTPDFYYETGRVTTLELQGAVVLPQVNGIQSRLTATAGRVRSDERDVTAPGHGYEYYSVGIEGQLDRIVFDFRCWNTNVDGFDVFDSRFVGSVGVKFP